MAVFVSVIELPHVTKSDEEQAFQAQGQPLQALDSASEIEGNVHLLK